ncbi:MAG: fold metallo-hydrolase [Firmicutes bacterium]|nr:fold metallo-hydrolase [Bacillota bacterium]
MQVNVLASGSRGNATLISLGGVKLLVDAGISTRRIKTELDKVGVNIGDLDGVLITHEHRDHISGLSTLTRKYGVPVYARPAAWEAILNDSKTCDVPTACQRELTSSLDIGGVKIEPFDISHDAVEPVGFRLYHKHTKCAFATDLGFVTDSVKKALSLSDVIILEANHDVDMLNQGSYPWFLKKRILSNKGHLANTDAGWTLARLQQKKNCHVFLAHLSQENNRPEVAEKTVSDILSEQSYKIGTDISLYLTYPDKASSIPTDRRLSI